MRSRVVIAVALLLVTVTAVTSFAQQAPLDVQFSAPAGVLVTYATFTIDGQSRRVAFDNRGQAMARFNVRQKGRVELTFIVDQGESSIEGRQWSTPIDLNGSGHLDYMILRDGRGAVNQWPLVAWLSASDRLDVALNKATIGSTRTEKGVAPNRMHTAEWRNSAGKTVCTYQFRVDYNVRRSFVCDAATGKVSEAP